MRQDRTLYTTCVCVCLCLCVYFEGVTPNWKPAMRTNAVRCAAGFRGFVSVKEDECDRVDGVVESASPNVCTVTDDVAICLTDGECKLQKAVSRNHPYCKCH